MKVMLISGRDSSPMRTSARLDADASFAASLVAQGCDVRWLAPAPADCSVPEVRGARVLHVPSAMPPFRDVVGRVTDYPTEHEIARQVRGELPDLVHFRGYGGGVSGNSTWVASRLGVPVLVSLHAAPVLCHRGDLVYTDRQPCETWDDPDRCAACCLVADSAGLSPIGSLVGRALSALRVPLQPFPHALAFENRREVVDGGLRFVDRILVPREEDRAKICARGLPPDLVEVVDEEDVDWPSVYQRVSGAAVPVN